MTLVIYDDLGYVIFQGEGGVHEPVGIPFLWVEIPLKKRVVSIDVSVTPHIPIYEDKALTMEEVNTKRIALVEEAMNAFMDML